MKISRTGILVSALPNLVLLSLFYSLAWHMFRSLGEWPSSIGYGGFRAPLIAHADVTMYFFVALIWFGMFVWPIAMLLCVLIPRWQCLLPYLAMYAVFFLGCWTVMQLAPEPFLYWWRD